MSKPPIGVCLLGLGRAGEFHLKSLRMTDHARLVCVYDSDADRSRRVSQRYDCHVATDAAEAIAHPQVDAVIVATPTDSHFEYVQFGLQAGKPVLTEKPLGRHLQQIDACFQLSETASVPLFVAFQRRFDPSFSSLVRAVRAGEVGQLQFVRTVSRDNPVPSPDYIRISGGIFHDCMVHDLDMLVHIVGETPEQMSAFASSFIREIGELDDFDNVVASLSFANGVVASIDINRNSVYGYDQRIEAFGDQGMVAAENRHETTVETAKENGFRKAPIEFSFPSRYREAYLAELECFVQVVRREAPLPISHEDVRVNHLLASGLEIAAREKRVVCFAEIESSLQSE